MDYQKNFQQSRQGIDIHIGLTLASNGNNSGSGPRTPGLPPMKIVMRFAAVRATVDNAGQWYYLAIRQNLSS